MRLVFVARGDQVPHTQLLVLEARSREFVGVMRDRGFLQVLHRRCPNPQNNGTPLTRYHIRAPDSILEEGAMARLNHGP